PLCPRRAARGGLPCPASPRRPSARSRAPPLRAGLSLERRRARSRVPVASTPQKKEWGEPTLVLPRSWNVKCNRGLPVWQALVFGRLKGPFDDPAHQIVGVGFGDLAGHERPRLGGAVVDEDRAVDLRSLCRRASFQEEFRLGVRTLNQDLDAL